MRNRLSLLTLVLTCVLLFPLWRQPVGRILAPQYDSSPSQRAPAETSKAFVMNGMDLLQTQGGGKDLRLTARRVFSENQEELLEMEDVRTAFFNDDGGVTITVSGEKGLYQPREQTLAVNGNVVVTGRENFEVRAELIRYTVREGIFETETAATVQGRGIMTQGEGLRYDTNTGILSMGGQTGRVSTIFRSPPQQ